MRNNAVFGIIFGSIQFVDHELEYQLGDKNENHHY